MYGITETTVHVTCRVLKEADTANGSLIGRPIPDLSLHILDPAGNPAPIGVPGEIYVGGAGVARGYCARPALTAERFVPHPFDTGPGARLYKTGDLARYRFDGDIEYLGRSDHQVKVRGFRIELGEIESVIRSCPGVCECAAIVRADAADDKRLIAYFVGEVAVPALREWVARRLPEYMLPSAIIVLGELPLTSNGKLDVKALPSPEEERIAVKGEYVAPRNATDELLARIWREVLKVERVGIHDNFFELGGHSLLAAQLAARISKELAVELRLGVIFEAPSISQLAAHVGSALAAGAVPMPAGNGAGISTRPRSLVELRPGVGTPLILMHAVGGGVSSYLKLADHVPDHRPIYVMQSVGLDGGEPPITAIEHMATRYLEELRPVRPTGPYQLGGWSMGGLIAFEMARRLEATGERVEQLLLFDCPAPPSLFRETMPEWPLGAYLQELADSSDRRISMSEEELLALARDPRRDELAFELARQHGIIPRSLTMEQLAHRVATYAANLQAVLAYRPGGTVDVDVLSFRGAQSSFPEGWAQWTRGEVMRIEVPGDHYTMLTRVGMPLEQLLGAAGHINVESSRRPMQDDA
jgi:thioesterase domain-containing protein